MSVWVQLILQRARSLEAIRSWHSFCILWTPNYFLLFRKDVRSLIVLVARNRLKLHFHLWFSILRNLIFINRKVRKLLRFPNTISTYFCSINYFRLDKNTTVILFCEIFLSIHISNLNFFIFLLTNYFHWILNLVYCDFEWLWCSLSEKSLLAGATDILGIELLAAMLNHDWAFVFANTRITYSFLRFLACGIVSSLVFINRSCPNIVIFLIWLRIFFLFFI